MNGVIGSHPRQSHPAIRRAQGRPTAWLAAVLAVMAALPACKPATTTPTPAPAAVAASNAPTAARPASASTQPSGPGLTAETSAVVSPIVAEPASVELGQMPPGALRTGTVQVRNTSSKPVTIKEVKTSCKCTTTDRHTGRVLQPGESVPVTATYQAKLEPGLRNQNVIVFLDGVTGDAGRLLIPVTAEVVMPIRANPGFLTAFGRETATPVPQFGSVTVDSTDGKPFHVLTTDRSAPVFIDGFKPGDPPRSSYTLQWDVRPYTTPDCSTSTIPWWWVVETDHPDCPILDLRIRHECTMVTADPVFQHDRTREWKLLDLRVLGGVVAPGGSTEILVPTEHLPDSVSLIGVESLTPNVIKEVSILRETTFGDNRAWVCRVTPADGQQGVIFGKVRFHGSDGKSAPIWVIASVR